MNPFVQFLPDKQSNQVSLDGLQDPHNLGAILRTCDAIGVDGVIICKNRERFVKCHSVRSLQTRSN